MEYPTYNKKKENNYIGYILRKNCLLKHIIEGKVEVKGRRGRRCKQLLDDVKETRGNWKLKEETLDPLCGDLTVEETMDLS